MRIERYLIVMSPILFSCCSTEPEQQQAGSDPQVSNTPWFVEAASQRGLDFIHQSGHDGKPEFPEIIGSGVAILDMENDGDLDIYVVQSGNLHAIGAKSNANVIYRNDGSGRFTDVTSTAGDAGDCGYGMGVAAGDIDRDGDVDLYVTNFGPDVLLRNNGDGSFTDITEESALGHEGWGASAAFLDWNHDGHLDLAVTNYVDWNPAMHMDCPGPGGRPDYCAPNAFKAPAPDVLYRNNGDGTFVDVSLTAGWRAVFGNGLGIVPLDYDEDGLTDVFIANDQLRNQLWRNQGDGTFVDQSMVCGVAVDGHGEPKAGMGVDAADVDDDGDLDLLVVNLSAQSDSFFRNEGGWFIDGTGAAGLGSFSRPYTRFGMGFHDFNNDGYLDLYMANGRVLRRDVVAGDPYAEVNVLMKGLGKGRFEGVMPPGGLVDSPVYTSRGAAFGDLDGDGGLDVVIINRDAPLSLLMNTLDDRGGFISIDLVDSDGAPAELATVTYQLGDRKIRREVRTASSYLSANPHRLHLGLGDYPAIREVKVHWPNGEMELFGDLESGSSVRLEQGQGLSER